MPTRPPPIDPADTPAVADLLTRFYPQIFRLAAALTLNTATAEMLAREVLQRSLRQLPRWHDLADAERWFPHMVVLLAREHLRQNPAPAPSPGVLEDLSRATTPLPVQQREALLLYYGEGFDPRGMATAMDCSATAASNHLAAALQRLAPAAGEHLTAFLQGVPQMLAGLVPPPGDVRLSVERQIRRTRWAGRFRRLLRWLMVLILLAAAIFLAMHLPKLILL